MANAPVIDSPCPFQVSALPTAGRDHCGHCDRQVHNLDGMSGSQRRAFMQSCTGKVCVAYTVHQSAQRRNLSLGVGLLASLTGSAAMAIAPQTPTGMSPKDQAVAAAPKTDATKPIDANADQGTTTHTVEQIGDWQVAVATTILTAEQIAQIPAPRGGGIDPYTLQSTSFVTVGSVLDAKQARWADESELTATDHSTLPEIGSEDWLPSKKTP